MSDSPILMPSTRRDALKALANGFGLASFAALAAPSAQGRSHGQSLDT